MYCINCTWYDCPSLTSWVEISPYTSIYSSYKTGHCFPPCVSSWDLHLYLYLFIFLFILTTPNPITSPVWVVETATFISLCVLPTSPDPVTCPVWTVEISLYIHIYCLLLDPCDLAMKTVWISQVSWIQSSSHIILSDHTSALSEIIICEGNTRPVPQHLADDFGVLMHVVPVTSLF